MGDTWGAKPGLLCRPWPASHSALNVMAPLTQNMGLFSRPEHSPASRRPTSHLITKGFEVFLLDSTFYLLYPTFKITGSCILNPWAGFKTFETFFRDAGVGGTGANLNSPFKPGQLQHTRRKGLKGTGGRQGAGPRPARPSPAQVLRLGKPERGLQRLSPGSSPKLRKAFSSEPGGGHLQA